MGRLMVKMSRNVDPLRHIRAPGAPWLMPASTDTWVEVRQDALNDQEDAARRAQVEARRAQLSAAHQQIGRAQENPDAMARAHSPSKAPKRPIGVHVKAISVLAAKIFGGLCGAFAVGLAILGLLQGNTWLWTKAPVWIALPISGVEFSVVTAAFVYLFFIKKW
jgi:hypothetical protein